MPTGTMTSGERAETDQRFIRQSLVWTALALESYTPSSELQIRLALNNSSDSELGAGIYIETNTTFRFSLPAVTVTGGYANLLPGDYLQHFNTYLSGIGSGGVQPLTSYFVEFIADAGAADQDNAEAVVIFNRNKDPDCTRFCNREYLTCRLHTEPYDVAPIPGEFVWPDLSSPPDGQRCYTGFQFWLPYILGF